MTDQPRNRWIGEPLDRVDGPAKVTGRATYAADHRGDAQAAIGFIVESTVGAARSRRSMRGLRRLPTVSFSS